VPRVRIWHKCEVPAALSKVRFQGQPGRHLLVLSSSQFDPQQSFCSIALCSAVALSGDTECQRITGARLRNSCRFHP
jgi:hypothetical protein